MLTKIFYNDIFKRMNVLLRMGSRTTRWLKRREPYFWEAFNLGRKFERLKERDASPKQES